MRVLNYAALLVGALAAAAGQMALKQGAHGRAIPSEFVNIFTVSGLGLYAIGTALWIYALAHEPLSAVYPFTILTFVLVMIGSVFMLGEQLNASLLIGSAFVVTGLIIVMLGQVSD
jgi:drug/metabolite transporter (DMT)-like permease